MKLTVLSLCLALLTFASCNKSHDNRDVPALPGTWQEVEMPGQFAGSHYRIIFDEAGSFRLKKSLFTDMLEPTNPCSDNRLQFARGRYTVSGKSLLLSGKYCDSVFSADVPDCRAGADFQEQHSLSGMNGQLILDDERGDYHRIVLNHE